MLRPSLALLLAMASPVQEIHRHFAFDAPIGGLPAGWMVTTPSHAGAIAAKEPQAGAACLVLTTRGGANATGIALTHVEAAPLRGKRIKLIGVLRAAPSGQAQLWIRVDRKDGRRGAFDNMADRPVRGTAWEQVELEADVADDAIAVTLGLLAPGAGAALDELSLLVLGPIVPPEPPRALDARGTTNLVALARLYGCVRWFHPSDAAANADWDALAVEGVRAVEPARDTAQLRAALTAWLAPIAPGVSILAEGEAPPPAATPPDGARVAFWVHAGVGFGSSPVYSSRRRRMPLASAREEGAADPAEPTILALGDGLRSAVPTSLWVTAPLATTRAASSRKATDDRATRLAAVVQTWNVFQHFYPYFEHAAVDWHSTLAPALQAMALAPDAAAGLSPLRRLVASLRDGHGFVSHGSDEAYATPPVAAAFVGDDLIVTAVTGELTTDAGIAVRRGDRITALDGEALASVAQRVGAEISAATPQFLCSQLAATLLRGPAGAVRLEIEGEDGQRHTCKVARTPQAPPAETRPAPIADVADGVLYVDIERIDDQQLLAAIPRLVAARGVVFDFRGYPGKLTPQVLFQHLIGAPVESARWLIPRCTRPDRADARLEATARWKLTPRAPRVTGKLAFVVDGRAISYAESCLGIVEHYALGALVGEASAGTNGNVNPFTTVGGYQISWTGMVVRKHDDSTHHGVGILPTHSVPRTRAGIRAGRDELLDAAVALVGR